MKGFCRALATGSVGDLPVKSPKAARRKRWFYYIHATNRDLLLMRERSGKDIWRHLHEMVLIESARPLTPAEVCSLPALLDLNGGMPADVSNVSGTYSQLLTHQEIHGRFIRVELKKRSQPPEGYRWVTSEELQKTPVPRLIRTYLDENG